MSATKIRNVGMQTDIRYTISAGLTIKAVHGSAHTEITQNSHRLILMYNMVLSFNLHTLTL
jgi:hypothetical protein